MRTKRPKHSREDGRDQESIQSSTIPDPEQIRENDTQHESQEVSPFQASDRKDARNRQYSITKVNMNNKKDQVDAVQTMQFFCKPQRRC